MLCVDAWIVLCTPYCWSTDNDWLYQRTIQLCVAVCKVTTWCMQFLRSYRVHKTTWPWANLKVWKGYTKVNIEPIRYVDVENIPPIKLQHHTRQYLRSYCVHKASWPLGSLKVQKGHIKVTIKPVQFFYVENTTLKIQHDTRNLQRVIRFTRSFRMPPTWKFKKVTHRSTSNLAEILMRRTLLPVKLQYDAGKYSEALSYSQGAATCRHLNMT